MSRIAEYPYENLTGAAFFREKFVAANGAPSGNDGRSKSRYESRAATYVLLHPYTAFMQVGHCLHSRPIQDHEPFNWGLGEVPKKRSTPEEI